MAENESADEFNKDLVYRMAQVIDEELG